MEAAACNEEVPLILPTNGSVKKKFRARKTMTASCREQLAILKLKNSTSKSDNTLKSPPIKDVQGTELFCDTNCTTQDTSPSKLNKSPSVFPNGLKVSIEVSQVDSGINIGCSYNETWEGITKKSEDAPFTHTTHFTVKNMDTAATENPISSLGEVPSAPSTESKVLSEDTLQTAESLQQQDEKTQCEQADMECSDISENLNASITVKIIDKDQSFENTSSIDVTMTGPPNTDCAVAPRNENEPSSCTTDVSDTLPCPSDFVPVPDLVQPMHDDDTVVGVCQKKRTCPESSNVPDAKRAKTSHSVLLDEIQCLIDRRIHRLFQDTFDQRIQTLIRQVKLIRRNGRRTNELARHLRSIKRLEKRLKYAVLVQGQLGTKLTPVSSSPEELHNTDATPNASTNIPSEEATESPPRPPSTVNPSTTTCTDLVVLSDNESEQPSNPERPNSASKKVDSAAMHKIMESIMEHRRRAQTDKAAKTIIDLTDEEQKLDKEINMANAHCIPNGSMSASSASAKENIGTEKELDKCFDKKDLQLSNGKEASLSCDVNEGKRSVTISPQSENLNESLAKKIQTSSNPEPAALKPPQKPQLRLAQVQNPKGIALSWNVTNVDPNCAPATAYCLYVHQGDPSNPKKLWKKIGEIKALPLPMACTLTQFLEDNTTTYSFAMRAKDANGRFGPLCDIQSTTLKTISSSKKS